MTDSHWAGAVFLLGLPRMLLHVRVPAGNERGPQWMQQALQILHQQGIPLALEYGRRREEILLACRVADAVGPLVKQQLYAQYPEARIEVLAEDALQAPAKAAVRHLQLRPDLFPIKQPRDFEDTLNHLGVDPLAGIFNALESARSEGLHGRITLHLRPARWWKIVARQHVFRIYQRSRRLTWFGQADSSQDLLAAAGKLKALLFEARLTIAISHSSPKAKKHRKRKFAEITGAFGTFLARRESRFRLRRRSRRFLLTVAEAAVLWHPPLHTIEQPTLESITSRDRPPPLLLPDPRHEQAVALLGVTKYRTTWKKFGIQPEDRFRHLALLGKTGTGKTTLLQRLIIGDIRAGLGVGVIDPHGDLIDAVLALIPRPRTNDVVLFDPADRDQPPAFNVLDCPRAQDRPLVASAVLSAFKKVFGDSWGPRMEYYFRNALLALLDVPDSTLLSLFQFVTDPHVRRSIARRVQNPVVRHVWLDEFPRKPARLQEESLSPIHNKIGPLVTSPLLCHVVGQSRSKINLRAIMDRGRILLVNLSKGKLGEDISALLGAFIVSKIQVEIMGRADQPPEERRPFFLYVDEFQNVSTESFATILSEARKYRLALTVANQYLGQLDEATRHALFGNIGSLACFQAGPTDAEILCSQLGEPLHEQDLMTIPRYHAYVRLLIDGQPTAPFSMRTLPVKLPRQWDRKLTTIRHTSRHRYNRPVHQVQREIAAVFGERANPV
jgi:hypothetical protein